MSTYVIDVPKDNEFNEGWLDYVLGLPFAPYTDVPPQDPEMYKNGWEWAEETPALGTTRTVLARERKLDDPHYVVKVPTKVTRVPDKVPVETRVEALHEDVTFWSEIATEAQQELAGLKEHIVELREELDDDPSADVF